MLFFCNLSMVSFESLFIDENFTRFGRPYSFFFARSLRRKVVCIFFFFRIKWYFFYFMQPIIIDIRLLIRTSLVHNNFFHSFKIISRSLRRSVVCLLFWIQWCFFQFYVTIRYLLKDSLFIRTSLVSLVRNNYFGSKVRTLCCIFLS